MKINKLFHLVWSLLLISSIPLIAQQQLENIWGKHFDRNNLIETGYAIAQDNDTIIVAGTTVEGSPAINSKVYLLKIDKDGNKIKDTLHVHNTNLFNEAYALVVVSDGYIIGGATRTALGSTWDCLLVKYDKNFKLIWSRNFGGTSTSDIIHAMCITTGSAPRILLSGTSITITTNTTGNDRKSRAFTLALGADQTASWGNRRDHGVIGTTTHNASVLYDIQPTNDGGAIAAGTIDMGGTDRQDYYLVKLNNTFAASWSKNFGGAGDQIGKSAVEVVDLAATSLPEYNYVIGGYESLGANKFQPFLLKLKGTDRSTIFAKKYGVGRKTIYNIRKTSDKGIIAIGSYGDDKAGGKYNIYVHKFEGVEDTLGRVVDAPVDWEGIVVGSPNGSGQAIVQAKDNINFFLVGRDKTSGTDQVYVAKIPPACPCITIKVKWPYDVIGTRTDVQDDRIKVFDVFVTRNVGLGTTIYYGKTNEKGIKRLTGLKEGDIIEVAGVKYLADVQGQLIVTSQNINAQELEIVIPAFSSKGF